MAGLILTVPEKLDPKRFLLSQVYDGERTYFKDDASGKCYANKDMRVELDPKTLTNIVAK